MIQQDLFEPERKDVSGDRPLFQPLIFCKSEPILKESIRRELGMKILVVEDSGIMRRAIAKIALEQGFKVVEAENGADGLAKLRKQGADIGLVILDWNMPVMDGYELLTKIRSMPEYQHVPILMATADGAEEDVVKAIKAGADSYLIKPFTAETLSERIKSVLSARSAVGK